MKNFNMASLAFFQLIVILKSSSLYWFVKGFKINRKYYFSKIEQFGTDSEILFPCNYLNFDQFNKTQSKSTILISRHLLKQFKTT